MDLILNDYNYKSETNIHVDFALNMYMQIILLYFFLDIFFKIEYVYICTIFECSCKVILIVNGSKATCN